MEVKKVIEVQDNAHLQDKQSHNKPASLVAAVEVEVQQPVEDNDKVLKKNDGLNTPTSPLKTIQPILTCPPAPRKPKAAALRKRKGSHITTALRLLDYSNDVLALYPPALLADFENKVKKAKRSGYAEQLKENIAAYISSSQQHDDTSDDQYYNSQQVLAAISLNSIDNLTVRTRIN